jgi:hypothetical protein
MFVSGVPYGTVAAMVFAASLITPITAGIMKVKEVIALDALINGIAVVVVVVRVVGVVVGIVVWIDVGVVVVLVHAGTSTMASIMMIDTANESMFFFFIYVPPFYLKTDVQNARILTVMFSELCKFQFLLRSIIWQLVPTRKTGP